jgi:hypothetical protein
MTNAPFFSLIAVIVGLVMWLLWSRAPIVDNDSESEHIQSHNETEPVREPNDQEKPK